MQSRDRKMAGGRAQPRNLVPASVGTAFDQMQDMDRRNAARVIFEWTERQVLESIEWYIWRKKSRSRWSKLCRASAIVAGSVGGIIPLVHAARPSSVDAEWGYVSLAVAASVILADRLFGFTSSWTRFMSTKTALSIVLSEAQQAFLAWEALSVNLQPLPESELFAAIEICHRLSEQSSVLQHRETVEWSDDLVAQIAAASQGWRVSDAESQSLRSATTIAPGIVTTEAAGTAARGADGRESSAG